MVQSNGAVESRLRIFLRFHKKKIDDFRDKRYNSNANLFAITFANRKSLSPAFKMRKANRRRYFNNLSPSENNILRF